MCFAYGFRTHGRFSPQVAKLLFHQPDCNNNNNSNEQQTKVKQRSYCLMLLRSVSIDLNICMFNTCFKMCCPVLLLFASLSTFIFLLSRATKTNSNSIDRRATSSHDRDLRLFPWYKSPRNTGSSLRSTTREVRIYLCMRKMD